MSLTEILEDADVCHLIILWGPVRYSVDQRAYPELDTDAISLVRRGVVVILLDAARQCL